MSKDPARLWYPSDWVSGVQGMSFEEKGAYMDLLMWQFNHGHMTSHIIGRLVGQHWVNIQDKFLEDENGKWYNKRIDIEKDKRKNFTDSRRNNLKGTNQYTKKPKKESGHKTSLMVNVNTNEDISINKGVKRKLHLFVDSEFYDYDKFREALKKEEEWLVDLWHYHGAIKDWSAAKGEKRKDWIATARSWMRKDKQNNQLVTKKAITPAILKHLGQ